MMRQPSLLARRYARAYLNLYGQSWTDDDIRHVYDAVQFFEQHTDMISYASMPSMPYDVVLGFLQQILKQFDIPYSVERLFKLLMQHKRISMLIEVMRALVYEYYKAHHIDLWDVISSHSLTEDQVATIKKYLGLKTGKTIKTIERIDKRLIAGICLQSATLSFEDSIRKQLDAVMIKDLS